MKKGLLCKYTHIFIDLIYFVKNGLHAYITHTIYSIKQYVYTYKYTEQQQNYLYVCPWVGAGGVWSQEER